MNYRKWVKWQLKERRSLVVARLEEAEEVVLLEACQVGKLGFVPDYSMECFKRYASLTECLNMATLACLKWRVFQ